MRRLFVHAAVAIEVFRLAEGWRPRECVTALARAGSGPCRFQGKCDWGDEGHSSTRRRHPQLRSRLHPSEEKVPHARLSFAST